MEVRNRAKRPHGDQSRRAGAARRAGRALRHMSFAASDRPVHRQPAARDKRPVEAVPRETHHRSAPVGQEALASYRSAV